VVGVDLDYEVINNMLMVSARKMLEIKNLHVKLEEEDKRSSRAST
jgi:hypothetical protein